MNTIESTLTKIPSVKHDVRFPHVLQNRMNDCGPACLTMIAQFYRLDTNLNDISALLPIQKKGVSLLDMENAALSMGLVSRSVNCNLTTLEKSTLPAIVVLEGNHYVVVYKITRSRVYISDPRSYTKFYTKDDFRRLWVSSTSGDMKGCGYAFIIERFQPVK